MARGLAKAGASVAIWSRSEEHNAAAVAELSELGEASGFRCDVTDPDDIATVMAATVDRYGSLNSFFANAGTSDALKFEEMTLDQWHRVLDVNLTGVFLTMQAATRQMMRQGEGGSIVATASVAASIGIPQSPHYGATKGGVLQLVRSTAVRLARYGIRVNALSPGWVDTEMTTEVQAHDKANQYAMMRTPMRRWGTPDDFEGPAVFLASDASAYMTAAELRIDGGFLGS